MNPIEAIKQELCSRYNLQPEQIDLDLCIVGADLETAEEILNDYAIYPNDIYMKDDKTGGHTLPARGFNIVHVMNIKL